jgi:hypothetical protein
MPRTTIHSPESSSPFQQQRLTLFEGDFSGQKIKVSESIHSKVYHRTTHAGEHIADKRYKAASQKDSVSIEEEVFIAFYLWLLLPKGSAPLPKVIRKEDGKAIGVATSWISHTDFSEFIESRKFNDAYINNPKTTERCAQMLTMRLVITGDPDLHGGNFGIRTDTNELVMLDTGEALHHDISKTDHHLHGIALHKSTTLCTAIVSNPTDTRDAFASSTPYNHLSDTALHKDNHSQSKNTKRFERFISNMQNHKALQYEIYLFFIHYESTELLSEIAKRAISSKKEIDKLLDYFLDIQLRLQTILLWLPEVGKFAQKNEVHLQYKFANQLRRLLNKFELQMGLEPTKEINTEIKRAHKRFHQFLIAVSEVNENWKVIMHDYNQPFERFKHLLVKPREWRTLLQIKSDGCLATNSIVMLRSSPSILFALYQHCKVIRPKNNGGHCAYLSARKVYAPGCKVISPTNLVAFIIEALKVTEWTFESTSWKRKQDAFYEHLDLYTQQLKLFRPLLESLYFRFNIDINTLTLYISPHDYQTYIVPLTASPVASAICIFIAKKINDDYSVSSILSSINNPTVNSDTVFLPSEKEMVALHQLLIQLFQRETKLEEFILPAPWENYLDVVTGNFHIPSSEIQPENKAANYTLIVALKNPDEHMLDTVFRILSFIKSASSSMIMRIELTGSDLDLSYFSNPGEALQTARYTKQFDDLAGILTMNDQLRERHFIFSIPSYLEAFRMLRQTGLALDWDVSAGSTPRLDLTGAAQESITFKHLHKVNLLIFTLAFFPEISNSSSNQHPHNIDLFDSPYMYITNIHSLLKTFHSLEHAAYGITIRTIASSSAHHHSKVKVKFSERKAGFDVSSLTITSHNAYLQFISLHKLLRNIQMIPSHALLIHLLNLKIFPDAVREDDGKLIATFNTINSRRGMSTSAIQHEMEISNGLLQEVKAILKDIHTDNNHHYILLFIELFKYLKLDEASSWESKPRQRSRSLDLYLNIELLDPKTKEMTRKNFNRSEIATLYVILFNIRQCLVASNDLIETKMEGAKRATSDTAASEPFCARTYKRGAQPSLTRHAQKIQLYQEEYQDSPLLYLQHLHRDMKTCCSWWRVRLDRKSSTQQAYTEIYDTIHPAFSAYSQCIQA